MWEIGQVRVPSRALARRLVARLGLRLDHAALGICGRWHPPGPPSLAALAPTPPAHARRPGRPRIAWSFKADALTAPGAGRKTPPSAEKAA